MGGEKNQVIEKMEVRLMTVGDGALTQKDVKNEGRSDYMHENTGDDEKMCGDKPGLLHENAPISR